MISYKKQILHLLLLFIATGLQGSMPNNYIQDKIAALHHILGINNLQNDRLFIRVHRPDLTKINIYAVYGIAQFNPELNITNFQSNNFAAHNDDAKKILTDIANHVASGTRIRIYNFPYNDIPVGESRLFHF